MNGRHTALLMVALCSCATDPASPFASRRDARSLDCRRLTEVEAATQFPGEIPPPPARGANMSDIDAIVCERQMLEPGERADRDEALLSHLSASVEELVQAARALEPQPEVVWHVDAFYPDVKVASKISVAARTRLKEHGSLVSDRVPLLAAGDVMVLTRMRIEQALPLSCSRYYAEGSLQDSDRFLGLMIVDPKETALHAGVCARGQWRWLR